MVLVVQKLVISDCGEGSSEYSTAISNLIVGLLIPQEEQGYGSSQ
jgi:hypothetical protein